MLFSRRFPYISERELADNLKPGSIIELRPLNYTYIKSPRIPDAVFVSYTDGKFVCTLPNTRRPNANFSVDFFDVEKVWTPDRMTQLYEKPLGRL